MKLRILLLLPLTLSLISCVYIPGSHRPVNSSPGNSAYGHCQSHKHSCEKYDKELHKKHPKADKIDRYRQECREYNQHCR